MEKVQNVGTKSEIVPLINESMLELLCIKPSSSWACLWTIFFAWAQLIY